ncbi:DUF3304 domain-containing protein [Burkholderia plantarii]|uniref:Lipoprotein n=1 Tax=Burkholderia plantarii TaxID=41899 RepID=A0A0B6RPN9_BURPL|nr:DUF3304 domain-containing protein [Burkholderia plantarii]AJK45308.1 hypothetical protein BGL_1c07740 [Burkholderia plantarii]ALK29581.1 hypothetical protein bpln_1g07560 [Burkholderia plantarii]GLZ20066.1 hypothetical protein Bpla01_35950 [Burkholderia plantarii]
MKTRPGIAFHAAACRLLVGLMSLLPLAACSERTMNLDVSIYNYWPRAIYDVAVNGQYAGGAYMGYHPGGAGGSVVCCIKVKPGPITIEYSLGGSEGMPRLGERIHATAVLQALPDNSKVLTMHVYPNGTAFAEASKEYVDERPEPEDKK